MRGWVLGLVLVALVFMAGDAGATPPPAGFDIYATGIDMNPLSPAPNTALSIGGGSSGIDAGDLQSASGNIPLGNSSSPTGFGHVCVDVVVDSVPNGGTPSGGVGIVGVGADLHWNGAIAGLVGYRAGTKNVGRTDECVRDHGATLGDPDDFLHSFQAPVGDQTGDNYVAETHSVPAPADTTPLTTGSFRVDNFFDDWLTETGPGRLVQFNLRCLASGSTNLTLDAATGGGGSTAAVSYGNGAGGRYSVHTEFEAMLHCDTIPPGDADGDGVADVGDNCPNVVNPGQADADGDGDGDVCDNCLTISNPSQANSDADTFGNACDNCPNYINQDQENEDADASGDICEPIHCRGVPNWWTSPGDATDPDCDGFTTAIESDPDIGTDPNDACANTPGANNEVDDKWPADFTDNQFVNTLDLTVYASAINRSVGHPQYVARADLNQNGLINTLDLVIYASAINRSCVPPP